MIGKVSVVIPTYNREKTILRAIQSVLDQTYKDFEVIVIDDGSTDGTVDIVNSIEDDRVKYVVLEQNGGPSKARNTGVQIAEGEWIAFQDSDDCWYKTKLETQIKYIKDNPLYSLVYCMSMNHFQSGATLVVPAAPLPLVMEGEMLPTLLRRNVIDTPTMFMRKEAFVKVGGFDTAYNALEDWEFVIRFAKEYKIGYVSEILMDSYMLNDGVSSNIGAYYEGRCRMLGQYKTDMMKEGMLEQVMQDILVHAQSDGVLDGVKKMMMLYLSQ